MFFSWQACRWEFDEEAFINVSEEGKEFIQRLLTKQKEKRMSAHECLNHPWLTGDHSHKTLEIARNRFFAIRYDLNFVIVLWDTIGYSIG